MNTVVVADDEEEEEVVVVMEKDWEEIDDIIGFNILTKVQSVESLFVRLRYVCKPWFNFITNNPFFHQSLPLNSEPPGLLIQTMDKSSHTYTTRFFKLCNEEEENQVEQVDDDLINSSCFKYGRIIDCFNGLVLCVRIGIDRGYIIVNPVTKQHLKLPPFFHKYYTKIIFVPSTGEYKAFQLIRRQHYKRFYVRIARIFIGGGGGGGGNGAFVDEGNLMWKLIKLPKCIHIGGDLFRRNERLTFNSTIPLAINGILYFTPDNEHNYPMKYIVCFDACDESFYDIAHPDFDPSFNTSRQWRGYLEVGGSLGYIRFGRSTLSPDEDQLDIYILSDHDRKDREWIKRHSISLSTPSFLRHDVRPLCTLRNGEVILFDKYLVEERNNCQAYDIKFNRWCHLATNMDPRWRTFAGLHVRRTTPIL